MNLCCGFLPSWNVQVPPPWGAASHKDGIIFLSHQVLHGRNAVAAFKLNAQIQDVASFFVNDFFRQSKAGDLRSNETARTGFGVKDGDLITLNHQITGDGQGSRACADAGHFLPI